MARLPALLGIALLLPAIMAPGQSSTPLEARLAPPQVRLSATEGRLSPEAKAAAEAGVKAMAKENFPAAEAAFLKLLRLSPDNPAALINLGLAEFRMGREEKAREYLQRAVRVKPEAGLAWMTLGLIDNNENEPEAATAAFAQAVYLEPKNARAHNYFAATLSRRGWYSAAEDELQRAIELEPNFAEAHFNLALTYLQRDPPSVELARRHYQKALELGAAPDAGIEDKLAKAPEANVVQ